MKRFANRIPQVMKEKNKRDNKQYAQKDMAEGTGLTTAAISRIINSQYLDHTAFSSTYLIAQWLEVPMEELVDVKDIEDED